MPNIAGAFGLRFVSGEHRVGRLICYYLTGPYNAAFALVLSMQIANTAGESLRYLMEDAGIWLLIPFISGHTKKVVTNAVLFLGYCTGNIAGPFFYKTEQAYVDFFPNCQLSASPAYLRSDLPTLLAFGQWSFRIWLKHVWSVFWVCYYDGKIRNVIEFNRRWKVVLRVETWTRPPF